MTESTPASATSLPTLAVAIATFQRPSQFQALLQQLPQRVLEAQHVAEISVLVVDNDPAGSARAVAEGSDLPHLRYVIEPQPGIAAARNRALDETIGRRLLVFIDDDEIPREGWLSSLVDTWNVDRPAAVAGRVVSILSPNTDPWVVAGDFFHRPQRTTGDRLHSAAAGNLLLDLSQVRQLGLRFDESLTLGAGEDTVFTRQMHQRGGLIVWCQESVTEDPVVPERSTRDWLLRRLFSQGNASVHADLRLATTTSARAAARLNALARGSAHLAIGASQHLAGRLRGDLAANARGLGRFHRARGILAAALGIHFQEYHRPS